MAAKFTIVFCATACFVQVISGQCIGAINNVGPALAAEELALAGNLAYRAGAGYGPYANPGLPNAIAPSSGGSFAVSSFSPIAPTGITVFSENAIEGALAVNGELPFLGAVAVEGALPSAGAGGINYGCGNGAVGIVSEGVAPGPAYPAGVGYANAGYGPGMANGIVSRQALGMGGCGAVY
ncbi:chorion class B protein PC10-like [Spodoptera litura]|uniref:Chorion class B protein PC10-like n=1 Tax=Spodoptera litura TaxID=69820 RepID=A0A9J7DSE9_SPOLT|nr:chorion class B protein PC10-like [Spodoptera litura]